MIDTVAHASLPCDEELNILKNRLCPQGDTSQMKRISVVTGIHGDELEGQYVCYLVQQRIRQKPQALTGIVDIYPAMNPMGIDSVTRSIPAFDLDMNRTFPGDADGSMLERLASGVIDDIKGSDLCIDIHASNIYLTEIPQVRINNIFAEKLVPLAKHLNVDLVWVHPNATVLESTLAHSLNSIGVNTLVVEMGVGMRITKEYCEQLTDGIFKLMSDLGIWAGDVPDVREPIVADVDDEISFLNAESSGLFAADAKVMTQVTEGQHLGDILDPLNGKILSEVRADCNGLLFTIREYPIVDEGSLTGRILKNK